MAIMHALDRKNVIGQNAESTTSPVQILILALFFQLLVFFLLLNSISEFSKKAEQVLTSLKSSLGADESVPDIRHLSIFPDQKNSAGRGTSLVNIAAQFQHETPGLGGKKIRHNGMLEMNIPINLWNKMTGLSPQGPVDPVLVQMLDFTLAHQNPSYRIVIQKNVRPELFSQHRIISLETAEYVSTLAQEIESKISRAHGRFSYGIGPGTPGAITIKIIPRDMFKEDMP